MRTLSEKVLLTLVAFQGLSGLAGGFGLISDPTGESLGIPLQWLENTIFDSYFIPGVILFVVLGMFPMISFAGLWKQKSWAITGSLIIGIALMIWITVEIFMIGYHATPPLQLIYGITGILITLFFWITMLNVLIKIETI